MAKKKRAKAAARKRAKSGGSKKRPAGMSLSDVAEARIVEEAQRKVRDGLSLTNQERAALRRFEKAQMEEAVLALVRALPKKMYVEWTGRQHKILNDQAALYGLPLSGPKINLPDTLRAFHDLLAKHSRRFAAADLDDPDLAGGDGTDALDEYRREKTRIARIEREELEGRLMPAKDVREILGRFAPVLANAGEILGKEFGSEARGILDDALDEFETVINNHFSREEGGGE